MNAIILLNKHSGISSNQLLQKVKRLFKANKAGHAGTLDPLATGMLAICFNKATRINQFLLNYDKCYQATIKLGTTTNSGDTDGKVLSSKTPPLFDTQRLKATLQSFVGTISQTPPPFSALKHQGKPLYYYARKGITVYKATRPITIHSLKLLEYQMDTVRIEIVCSKGTYVRSLAESIGEKLDCGACISSLHRVWSRPFEDLPMYSLTELQQLEDSQRWERCLNISVALKNLPHCELTANTAQSYLLGKKISRERINQQNLPQKTFPMIVYSHNQLLGIADLDEHLLHPRKLLTTSDDLNIPK